MPLISVWSKAHGLREFKNRVVRKIFCPEKEEVTMGWRK
jgi:hypothetical protein